ncbi:hypothetical protein BDV12DRAFT_167955 [Aspergillus spectabilis]
MEPDIQEIVAQFRRLGAVAARRAAYHQIIDQLSSYEWRDVKNRINERSFQKDILGELPVELAMHIIRYLNLDDVHLLRRVSKRWHDLLSSETTCSVMFRLYTGCPLSNLESDFKSTFARYSRQRLRLEQGNPHRMSYIEMPFLSELSPDFSNGRFVYTTDNSTTIVVFDLSLGYSQRFCTKHREKFQKIRLSESIVAAITIRGYCHAWDLVTEKTHAIRLPNTNISLFITSGFRIAMCFRKLGMDGGEDTVLLHYDLQSQKTHTIQHVPGLAFVSMNPSSKFLLMICLEPKRGREPNKASEGRRLRIVNYELNDDGEIATASTHSQGLPLECAWMDVGIRYDLQDDCKNSMAILYARPASGISAGQRILPVTYHPQTDEICVHSLLEHQVAHPLCIASVDKDILYWIRSEDGRRKDIWVSRGADTPLYASRNMNLGLPRDPADGVSLFTHTHHVLLGDSRFVSMIDATGTRIWHFEETAEPKDRPQV